MSHEWHEPMADWHEANESSASIETALEALGCLIAIVGKGHPTRYGPLLVAAAALVPLYVEFGTDPDGEATQRLYAAASELGWVVGDN